MKRLGLFSLLFATIFLFGSFSTAKAQIPEPPPSGQEFAPPPTRPNLLQALGLTREQIQQLRRLNAEAQPQKREFQRRLKEANQALDEAIYADEANDEIIKERVKEVQLAQAEMIRHRAFMETSIRKILSRDQLIKFRQLRQDFANRQGNPNNKRQNPDKMGNPNNRPFKRGVLRPNQRP